MHAILAEFIGTALLILLGNGVVANVVLPKTKGHASGWIVISFGWAMAVFVAVWCTAAASGAHLNPAVTVTLAVLRGMNHDGKRIDGSVGKSFAYGAQYGRFIVQGNADTRACIRLSGADVIFGGEVKEPLRDPRGASIDDVILNLMTAKIVLHIFAPKKFDRFNTLAEVDKAQWYAIPVQEGTTPQQALADYTSDPSKFGKILEQLAKTITVQSEVPLVLE